MHLFDLTGERQKWNRFSIRSLYDDKTHVMEMDDQTSEQMFVFVEFCVLFALIFMRKEFHWE